MLINQGIAVSTSSVLLVPYTASHVPAYHEWMKDSEIQQLTASEPLSLSQEHEMQRSWRQDGDKLTFIICLPLPPALFQQNATAGEGPREGAAAAVMAGEETMIGDVNIFLSPPDEEDGDERICVGELELMIAQPESRRKGYGRGAVLAFMRYVESHLGEILGEFSGAAGPRWKGLQLRVKIGAENEKSIGLFDSVGFRKVGDGAPNYFGEIELRREGVLRVCGGNDGEGSSVMMGLGVGEYREVDYVEEKVV